MLTLNIDDNRNRLLLSISKFQFVFRIKVKPADDGYWVVCFNFLYQWHQTKNLRSRLGFLKINAIQWFHKFNQTSFVFFLRKKKRQSLDCIDLNDLKSWWTCITVIQICIIILLLTPLLEILIFRHLISVLCSSWSSILKGLRLLALVIVGNHCSACNTSYNIFLKHNIR